MATGILKYKLKTRINPQDKDAEPKWYAKAVQDRTIDFEGLVTHMSEHNSPYSRGVIHGVLTDMLDCVKELVLDGKSVRLGDLGLFSVGLKKGSAQSRKVFGGYQRKGCNPERAKHQIVEQLRTPQANHSAGTYRLR